MNKPEPEMRNVYCVIIQHAQIGTLERLVESGDENEVISYFTFQGWEVLECRLHRGFLPCGARVINLIF